MPWLTDNDKVYAAIAERIHIAVEHECIVGFEMGAFEQVVNGLVVRDSVHNVRYELAELVQQYIMDEFVHDSVVRSLRVHG